MLEVAFQIGEDLSTFAFEWGPLLVLIVGLLVVLMYGLAYFTRYFQYLKMQESRYLDEDSLDVIHRVLEWVWIGIFVLFILCVAQTKSVEARTVLVVLGQHIPSIFTVVIVLLITVVMVRSVTRYSRYLRGILPEKPEKPAPPRFMGYVEIISKYAIYMIGVLIAIIGGIALLPGEEQKTVRVIMDPLSSIFNLSIIGPALAFIVVLIIAGFVVARLSDSLLEDIKARTTKFSPRVIDLFKSITRYAIYGIVGIWIVFLLISLAVGPLETAVIAVIFAIIVLAVVIVASSTLRNAFAGLALMISDPFDEGDRVKILNDLVCDITQMNLTLTQVRTLRGEVINVPNEEIIRQRIVNFSRSEAYAMSVDIEVPYDVPHEKVERLMIEAAEMTEGIVDDPPPEVYGKDIVGNAILHQLLAFTKEPVRMKRIRSELIYNIQDLFHKNGIEMLALED